MFTDEELDALRTQPNQVMNLRAGAPGSSRTSAMDPDRVAAALSAPGTRTVRCFRRPDGVVMVDTPLRFPDGDRFPLYLDEDAEGVFLSDRGHTLMHISYEHDVDQWFEGSRAPLREQIVRDYGLKEENGAFVMRTSLDRLGASALLLAQALTRIHDLTFLHPTA